MSRALSEYAVRQFKSGHSVVDVHKHQCDAGESCSRHGRLYVVAYGRNWHSEHPVRLVNGAIVYDYPERLSKTVIDILVPRAYRWIDKQEGDDDNV